MNPENVPFMVLVHEEDFVEALEVLQRHRSHIEEIIQDTRLRHIKGTMPAFELEDCQFHLSKIAIMVWDGY
jgi:hypothetical protein